MTQLVEILRYVSAHVAAIGGAITGLVLILTDQPAAGIAALLAALAGFGVPLTPAAQAKLRGSR